MSTLSHSSTSPAAAPPLEDENLLTEILLLLPPEPSSLPRASAVCKRWRRHVSDPRFVRRFRLHHRRNPPPLLGFFGQGAHGVSFQPTLEAPNRVAPERFSFQQDRRRLRFLGCRHGLVLMLDPERKQALVWDPVTGDQDRLALPPLFDSADPLTHGAVLRAAGDVHFQVVLVVAASDDELHPRVLGCVYSSETGLWGNLTSTPLPSMTVDLSRMPAVLVGDYLYWIRIGEFPGILEFDLETQSLDVMLLPPDMFEEEHQITVLPAEGGGLGFLYLSRGDLRAELWKRRPNCGLATSWELGRTIELGKLLSLNSVEERKTLMIAGFAECNNRVFFRTRAGLFMVHLESLQLKKDLQADNLGCCQPFESVYAAGN